MTLSKRGDYVVRSALCLARSYESGRSRKIREVVAEMAVPQTYASQILADLVRAGLAVSKAGKDGGYRLARAPETVSLLEVVEAGEGSLHADRCALGEGPCRWEAVCPLHETWRAATSALREVLAASTLADLAGRDRALERGGVPPPVDSHRHLAASIAVADRVQIEDGAPEVVACLGHESCLEGLLQAAAHDADALRRRLDPVAPPWTTAQVAVATELLPDTPGPDQTVHLSYQATTDAGLPLHLEGTLRVHALDPDRAEVRARLKLRPPPAPGGSQPPDGLTDKIARALVRSMLRELALTVEGHRSPVGAGRR